MRLVSSFNSCLASLWTQWSLIFYFSFVTFWIVLKSFSHILYQFALNFNVLSPNRCLFSYFLYLILARYFLMPVVCFCIKQFCFAHQTCLNRSVQLLKDLPEEKLYKIVDVVEEVRQYYNLTIAPAISNATVGSHAIISVIPNHSIILLHI